MFDAYTGRELVASGETIEQCVEAVCKAMKGGFVRPQEDVAIWCGANVHTVIKWVPADTGTLNLAIRVWNDKPFRMMFARLTPIAPPVTVLHVGQGIPPTGTGG